MEVERTHLPLSAPAIASGRSHGSPILSVGDGQVHALSLGKSWVTAPGTSAVIDLGVQVQVMPAVGVRFGAALDAFGREPGLARDPA